MARGVCQSPESLLSRSIWTHPLRHRRIRLWRKIPSPTHTRFHTEGTKETDVHLGASFGGEYFPFTQFSVGGELQLNYTSYGNPDITQTSSQQPPATSTTSERKQHLWNTDALFFVRWYFVQTN